MRLPALALLLLAPYVATPLAAQAPAPFRDSIPGTLVSWEMVPVAGGTATLPGPDGPRTVTVAPFWIGRTEVTWDAYDVFAFLEPVDAPPGSDAVARPSHPYGAPDRGFGHAGYPAISVTRAAAQAFAQWLAARTGRAYRLPTEAEWARAAALAAGVAPLDTARLDALAWHAGNAGGATHPVARRHPDQLGLYDLFGNAGEWVVPDDGALVLRGGRFTDPLDAVGPAARARQDYTWNETDPQIPKSPWWLSDGPFAGFRIVVSPP
jgi:formylglycine-generating enzyme required for sulfatase activity